LLQNYEIVTKFLLHRFRFLEFYKVVRVGVARGAAIVKVY